MDFTEVNLTEVLWMHRIFENWKIAVRLVNAVTPTKKVKNTNISANYNNSAISNAFLISCHPYIMCHNAI